MKKAPVDPAHALTIAKQAAGKAGEIQMEYASKKLAMKRKGVTDLVTEVDLKCETAIVEIIKDAFGDHSILTEEAGQSIANPDYKWIIDPLDGTTNYFHRFPIYCSSVAFEAHGVVVAGAVYDPNRDEMFCAVKGGGATLNGGKIKVSQTGELVNSLLATGFPYAIRTEKRNNIKEFASLAMRAQAIRRPGSAALDLCYVACGRLDGFWEFHLKPWDMAGGALIASEAGGKVTGANGESFSVYHPAIVASNTIIHNTILETLAR